MRSRGVVVTRRSERGSGTVLVLGVLAVVMVMSFAAACVGGYLMATHRARAAADLAALAGASVAAEGGDACQAARLNALANNASVTACDLAGDQIDFVLTVTTVVKVTAEIPGLPQQVSATAYAGSVSS